MRCAVCGVSGERLVRVRVAHLLVTLCRKCKKSLRLKQVRA
jgi:ribosome-binding protein aMBF1 (putative translation factor)